MTAGDINAGRLAESALPGRVVACIDVLHEGPTPAGVDDATWRTVRADYVASRGWAPREAALARLAEADAAITAADREDEVVLWFEHDLVCQLMLVRLIDQLRRTPLVRLSLVCIGEHPTVPAFRGLGDLTPVQLRELFAQRTPLTSAMITLASSAWAAVCADDPTGLASIARRDHVGFPYLAPALRRHIEQFPGTDDGLARTERLILDVLSEAPRSRRALWGEVQAREATPFMTDLIFWGYLDGLRAGPTPLAAQEADVARLTADGEGVVNRRCDAIALRGIDRWLGGVHVQSPPAPDRQPVWRWNAGAEGVERA